MPGLLERYATVASGLLLIAVFMVAAPNFASEANLINVVKDTSFLAILALGFTLALTVAELDLSVAEVASLAAVVVGFLIQQKTSPLLAVPAALLVAALFGALNGFGVTVLRVPSLITTLATAAIARGCAFMITQGVAFVGRWPVGFTGLARGTTLGVPNLVLWLAGITAAAWFLLAWTRTGAQVRFDANAATRVRGRELDAVLAENSSVKEIGKFTMGRTQSWRDDVRSGVQALLLQHQGKINGIWAAFDGQAYIVDDLMQSQGMKRGQIPLVSMDGGQESFARIADPNSLLLATVNVPFEAMGVKAVDAVDRIVIGKAPKASFTSGPYLFVESTLVDASNVKQFLKT
jgi:hypothetical protein